MRKVLSLTAIVALAFALSGCATSAGGSGNDATGSWGKVDVQGEPSLDLAEGGRLSGSDGCNLLMGNWSQDGDTVTFSDLASTMMACEDIDTWLNLATSGTVSGDTMTLLDADDKKIGTLERNE